MSENKKRQSLGEEIANAVSHGVGAILALVGLILMILKAESKEAIVGVTLFGICALILYTMSTLYHSFVPNTTTKNVFHRFDHSSIYLLIGGTYLPVYLIVVNYPLNLIFIILQWAVIITGISLKGATFNKFKKIHFILYIILGWSGLMVIKPVYNFSLGAFYFILAGGLSYTIGTLFYGFKWFKYSHFVWHLFVIMGTILHFFAVYLYLI